jgi:hypothetical protein
MPGEGVQKSIPDAAFAVLREYLEARAVFDGGDFDAVRDAFFRMRRQPGPLDLDQETRLSSESQRVATMKRRGKRRRIFPSARGG